MKRFLLIYTMIVFATAAIFFGTYKTPSRLMLLGDSITYGQNESIGMDTNLSAPTGGYRPYLWRMLQGKGCLFVGSVDLGDAADWDWHCEAHMGASTRDVAKMLPTWSVASRPDKVLELLGVNDLRKHIALGETVANQRAIWRTLRADNPSVKIYVGSVLHCIQSPSLFARNDQIDAVNSAVLAAVLQEQSQGQNIEYVDLNHAANLQSSDYAPSGLHLSQPGYQKLARAWCSALSD